MKIIFNAIGIAVLLLIVSNLDTLSQDYTPFNFSDGVWIEVTDVKGSHTTIRQLYCQEDTLIGDKTFNKLYEFSISSYAPAYYPDTVPAHYIGAIRNNESKQVIFIGKDEPLEAIIYDFNNQQLKCYREWDNPLCLNCGLLLGQKEETIPATFFPNPTMDELNINSVKLIYSITILELTGIELYSRGNIHSYSQKIQLGKYRSGAYIIKVQFHDVTSWSTIIYKN